MARKEYTYEEICRAILAKNFSPIYFLMGEEPFFIDKITDLLVDHVLSESERDFNQLIFYGADTDVASIINAAKRFPMMSEYQLIIVKEAQQLRNLDLLANYAKKILKSTILIINYKYKNYDRRKSLLGLIEQNGIIFESKKIPDYKIPTFITSILKQRSIGIDPKASQMLADFLGNDLTRIDKELDKLSIILNEEKNTLENYPEYGTKYGTIEIEKIDLELPIYFGDTLEILKNGIGHSSGSYFPGEGGSIIYMGHNYKKMLRRLGEVQKGNLIKITTTYGEYTYKVYDMQLIKETELDKLPVQREKDILMLDTCYPFNNIGYATQRYVVYAELEK